jgi:TP901 family phage tail tape measure protein
VSDKIVTQISVGLDPESIKKLRSQVSSAIGEGGSGAIGKIQKILGELGTSVRTAMSVPGGDKIFGSAISQIEEMQRILAESSKMPKGMAKSFGTMTSAIEKSAVAAGKLVAAEKEVAKTEAGVAAAVSKTTETVKQSGVVSEKVSRKKIGDTKRIEQSQNALNARLKTLDSLSVSSAISSSGKIAETSIKASTKAYNHRKAQIKSMIELEQQLQARIARTSVLGTRFSHQVGHGIPGFNNSQDLNAPFGPPFVMAGRGVRRPRSGQKPLFPDRASDAFTNVALYGMASLPIMYGRQAARQSVERDAGIRNAMSIGFDPGKDSGIYSSYEKLSSSIFDIAQSSGIAASEVDKLAMSMAQAGLAGKESERILSAMARASKLSFGTMDSDSAIAGFNALKNTFYKDVKDPAEKATLAIKGLEKAIFIANKSAANPQQLIEAFTRIGSVGKMAGYTADETMTWLTSAGEMSGLTPQAMATTLNRTLARTRAPEIVQKLKSIGIDMRKEEDNSFKSIKEIVAELNKKRKLMGTNEQQQLDLAVAGNVQFSRWAPLMEALDTIEGKMRSLGDADDAIKRQIEMSNEGLGVSFTRLWNSIEQGFLASVDESSGIYMFKKAIDAVSESLGAMAENSGKHFDTMLMYMGAFVAGASTTLAPLSPYIAFAATLKAGYDIAVDFKNTRDTRNKSAKEIDSLTDKSSPAFKKWFMGSFSARTIGDVENEINDLKNESPLKKAEEADVYRQFIQGKEETGASLMLNGQERLARIQKLEAEKAMLASSNSVNTMNIGAYDKMSIANLLSKKTLQKQKEEAFYSLLTGEESEKTVKAGMFSKLIDQGKSDQAAVMATEAIGRFYGGSEGDSFKAEMMQSLSESISQSIRLKDWNASRPEVVANKETESQIKTLTKINESIIGTLDAFKDYKDQTTISGKHDPVALAGIEAMLSGYKGMYSQKNSKEYIDFLKANKIEKLSPAETEENKKIRTQFVNAFAYINSAKNTLSLKSIRAGKRASVAEQKISREAQDLLNKQKKNIANTVDAIFGGYIKDVVAQYSPEEMERFRDISKPIASPSKLVGTLISDAMTAISENPASLLESIDVVSIYQNVSEAIGKAINESMGEGSIAIEQTKRMLQVGKFALGLGLGAGTYGGLREVSYGGAGAMGLNYLGIGKGVVPASQDVDTSLKTKFDDAAKEEEKAKRKLQEETNQWLKKIEKSTDKMAEKGSIETSLESALMSMMSGGGTGGFSGIKDSIIGSIAGRFVDSARGGVLGGRTIQSLFGGLEFAAKYGSEYSNVADKVNQGWIHGAGNLDKMGIAMTDMTLAASGNGLPGLNSTGAAIGGVLSKAGAGSSLAAGAKAGAAEGLIGGAAKTLITGIGTVMTIWAAAEAVNSIANAIGIGGTRVRHDDRPLVDQQNERLSQSYGAMMSSATSGQYTSSDIRNAYAYKPDYSAVYETTSDRGFFDKLFKGKDSHYYSNNAALSSIAKIEKMQYESIMTAGELEIEYTNKEIKMQREKLNRMETVIDLQKKMVIKGEEVDLASLAQKEIEAMSLRHAMFTDAIDKGYAAIGTTDVGMTIRGITKKYDPTGLGTTANGGIDPRALSRYFNGYTTGGVYGTTLGGGGFSAPRQNHSAYFVDAIREAGSLSRDEALMTQQNLHQFLTGSIGTGENVRVRTAGTEKLESAISSGKIGDTQKAIEAMVKELEFIGADSSIADEMAEIIAIAEDIVTLQRAMLQAQINQSVTMIESSDYLANIESSNKTITDIEKASNISYSSFAEKLYQGKIGAIGDDKWTYRNQAIDQRIAAISTFSGGAFSGTDLMQNLYNASYIDRGIGMMTGKTEEEQKYVKQLITELASAVSGMFGAYTDNSSAANNEDAKMYEVGSSGKYYITQNFTVESTYFGGSQAEAVQFLKFLSKAWNDSGSKNTTQRLF